jgi:hypothetical protein
VSAVARNALTDVAGALARMTRDANAAVPTMRSSSGPLVVAIR